MELKNIGAGNGCLRVLLTRPKMGDKFVLSGIAKGMTRNETAQLLGIRPGKRSRIYQADLRKVGILAPGTIL